MNPRDRILALKAPHELRDRLAVGDLGDHAKQCGFLVRLLRVGCVQEVAHAEAVLLRTDHIQNR